MQDLMDVERDLIDSSLYSATVTDESIPASNHGESEDLDNQTSLNKVAGGIKMNTGSYRKRKAKKQVGLEMTLEDLRGTSHIFYYSECAHHI